MNARVLILAAAAAWPASHVRAQNIDHAALGKLFGEPITTSATGEPQKASEAPASVVIITRDDIAMSPAADIPGVLKAYAGIDVVRWTASQTEVTVRGGVEPWDPRLLVLVNGRQVYLDHYGMTSWNNLGVQLEEVEQIEIVKGPNSALFGFNAVAGVVNIITVNPLHTRLVRAAVERGTDGYRRSSGMAAFEAVRNLGIRLSAGYEHGREFDRTLADVGATGGPANRRVRREEVGGEATLRLGERLTASFSGNHSLRAGYERSPISFNYAKYVTGSLGASLTRDMDWGILSAKVYRNWLDHHLPANATVNSDEVLDSRVFVASAEALVSTSTRQTVRGGLEYRSNEMMPLNRAGIRYRLYAANGMVEQQLGEDVTATLAGRVDRMQLARTGSYRGLVVFPDSEYDRSLTDWSMNAALRIKLDAAGTLRLSGGRGLQAPSLINLGVITRTNSPEAPIPVLLSGNPHVDPLVVWNGEVGYSRKLRPLDAQLEVTAFFRDAQGLLVVSGPPRSPYAPPAYPFVALVQDQLGGMQSYGLEASLTGRAGSALRWGLNYTWNALADELPDNDGGQFVYPYSYGTTTPRHKVNLQLGYRSGAWEATGTVRYLSGTRQFAVGTPYTLYAVPGHVGIDGRVGYRIGNGAALHVAVENLTDAGRFFNGERRVRAGLSVDL